jgi:hypothetical protein
VIGAGVAAVHERAAPCADGAPAPGLVLSKTSQTLADLIEIDRHPEAVFARRIARMRRSVWWSGQGHGASFSGHYGERPWFVTLTYRPGTEWSAKHVAGALDACRKWAKRRGIKTLRYTWVAELQKRGAVHYHLVIYLPKRLSMPKWDKQGWWPHGMTNTQVAKTGVGYLMKYVSKLSPLHTFPPGMRLFGIGGLNVEARAIRTWHNLPRWAKDTSGVGAVTRRACGLVVRTTGEILESPWVLFKGGGRLLLRAVAPLPERFADGPYSTWSMT